MYKKFNATNDDKNHKRQRIGPVSDTGLSMAREGGHNS